MDKPNEPIHWPAKPIHMSPLRSLDLLEKGGREGAEERIRPVEEIRAAASARPRPEEGQVA